MRYLTPTWIALAALAPSVAYAQEGFTYQRVVGILFGLVNFLFTAGIILAVIFIVWNAIKIMGGGGIVTPDKGPAYSQAKKNIFNAIIGVAIILGVSAIVRTVEKVVLDLSR